ncbi:hypothetical protein AVEN_266743-2 [Araneus ventricosus]|uniref:Uncharacterized protein n=1 Tax=Araneus ventricosus TaxID=182803 RepID=A0A4Y2H0D0_ARAVE|nr:hypothetical protein AVEN_266743-2 [Araneus ventricosus]
MSSESSESDNVFSMEDIELTEFARRSDGYSDSGSSADFTTSCRWPMKRSDTDEDNVNDVVSTSLNTSDENHHEFDIERKSLSSLEGTSLRDFTRTRRSFPSRQASVLTRKASSLEAPSIRRVSSVDLLEGPSTRRVSSLDPLERTSTRRVSSLDPLEGTSTRRVSSLDPLEGLSTRRVSSLDLLKGPSIRRALSLEPLKGPSTRRVSSLDPLEGPSTRRVSSLDPLEGPSTRRVSSLGPLEGPLTRRVSSLDPLEGPSTRRVWFSDSAKGSLTSIYTSHDSETETNEPSDSEPPTEQNGYWFRMLTWLSSFSRQIRHSKYYLLFHVALVAIPCSAGYMGSKYHSLCDGCPKLPFLVYLSGMLGMWIITIRIAAILSKRYFAPPLTGSEFNSCLVSIILPFFMFLLIEMVTTYTCEPVFIHPHKEFCIKVFYNYAYYLNVIVPLVILLLMLMHLPGCFGR